MLLVAIVAVVVFGVSIDVSRWRDAIAVRASDALGRPVALDGPLELELGRESSAARGRNSHPQSARVRYAGARYARRSASTYRPVCSAAWGMARTQLRGRRWPPALGARGRRTRQLGAGDEHAGRFATTGSRRWPSVEIERVSIRNFAFEYHDIRADVHHSLQLDELSGVGKWSEPLKLTLHGHVANSFPYSIDIEGGSAQLLQEAREAWPFALDFAFLGTRLHASGTVEAGHAAARFDFGAGTEDLQQVGRFLQTKLPDFGAAALSGTVHLSASAVEVGDLHGVLGATEFAGGLVLNLGGARQRLSGELRIATLDVRPFFEGTPDRSDKRAHVRRTDAADAGAAKNLRAVRCRSGRADRKLVRIARRSAQRPDSAARRRARPARAD